MEITSRGHRLHADVTGDGPTVVLVPGHAPLAEDWVSAGYPDALNDRFRVVVVDRLGDDTSADLLAVLDAVDAGAACLWGYARGARVVEAFARRHPERTTAVVLGGLLPADRGPLTPPAFAYVGTGESFWEAVRDWSDTTGNGFAAITGADHAAAFSDSERVLAAVEPFLDQQTGMFSP